MSFVGQFRPSWQASRPNRVPSDLAMFAFGFLASSVGSFLILHSVVGTAAASRFDSDMIGLLAGTAILAFAIVDTVRIRRRNACSVGPRRQTPQRWGQRSPVGVLFWGFDTGIPVTTVRATGLPLAGVAASLLGLGGPWLGLAYAGGFLGALFVACAARGPFIGDGVRSAQADEDIVWSNQVMTRTLPAARVLGVAVMLCVGSAMVLRPGI